MHNTCTCPDYKTNLIGTCKHIEGVLIHLREEYADRLDELTKQRPRGVKIYLHYGVDVTVRVELPLPDRKPVQELLTRYFDPSGVLVGAPLNVLPILFALLEKLPERERQLVLVDEAVREHLELLQDREEVAQQKEWFLDQVKRGRRTFDVLSTKLYPYQEQGAMHLAFGRRAMLADDMGLGKTVQAIAAAALLKDLRDIQKAVIICPASLKSQWAREIRRFTSLSVTVVEGGLLERRKLYNDPAFFKIINYELVRHDLPELLKLRPDLIILDEAQRIKNWRTKTAQMVKSLPSRYAFVLTGTPLENRIDELYSIFQFLDPRILGPLWHFNDRFYELEQRDNGSYKVLGYKNLDELRQIVAPYSLRRTRGEVLKDLPSRTDNNFFVEMTEPQWQAYNEYKEHLAKLISIAHRRPLTPKEREILMLCLIKMRLICNALALHDKELSPKERERTGPKLGELGEILAEEIASNGHKAVVFSQWANMLALAEPIIQRVGLGYVKLTGDVPSSKRGDLIQKFFDDPACRVFLSTDAGGVGLNLQAASLVINLDLPWNPAVLEQRIARAHRHGQQHSVQVINLIAKGTIEERMLDTLAAKRDVFASVFGTEDAPSAIHFEDTGQGLLKQLGELLKAPVEVELDLRPVEVPAPEEAAAPEVAPRPAPTLKGFADLLLDRLPGKVLVVRKAPTGEGILVVVTGAPAELRPAVETVLSEHYIDTLPVLHLMEAEGYQSLLAFLPPAARPEEEVFHATAMPKGSPSGRDPFEARRKKANAGLAFAEKRLALAEVVLKGGFPEEMLRPIRESLGWGLTSLLALHHEADPAADLPSPRRIHADLVEPGHLSEELAARLSRVRELTAPPEPGDEAPPPSIQTGETLAAAVRDLLDLAREQVVKVGL
jgi:superfamily II DNA or RNA helicase